MKIENKIKMIDIGANLTNKQFKVDLEKVLNRSKESNVAHIILTGTCSQSNKESLAMAKGSQGYLTSTTGLHPHYAKNWNDDLKKEIVILSKEPEVVAVGECGLDYNRDFSPRDIQKTCFEEQLQIAVDVKKPVFLHERDAHEDFFEILKKYRDRLAGAVVHCFTGNEAALSNYLDLGCYIGVTGWVCDPRRGKRLQELVKKIPLDKLMIETDAPYLLPLNTTPKLPGRRNEPSYLVHVLKTISDLRTESFEELSNQLFENTTSFFKLKLGVK